MFSVWDTLERNEISLVVLEALAGLFPDMPPIFLAMAPFSWHDRETIAATLARAGFRDMEIDVVALPTTFPYRRPRRRRPVPGHADADRA